jgi:probable HAF family extracellular repeat protein
MRSFMRFCLVGFLTLTSLATAQNNHAFLWMKASGMQDLGTLGGSQSYAFGINASGEVVGASDLSGDIVKHAIKWTQAGGMQDLGTLSGFDSSFALGVNTSGQVAGYAFDSSDTQNCHAVLWGADGSIQDLGTLGGSVGVATGVNDSGVVSGYSDAGLGSPLVAFVWRASTGMQKLSSNNSIANAIGPSTVAGYYVNKALVQHAAMWGIGTGFKDLGTLGGSYSVAFGLNVQNIVVGSSEVTRGGGNVHGFVWTKSTGMKDLGTLPGGNYSAANAVNSHGVITGVANLSNGDQHAVVWSASGTIVDIGTLGGVAAYSTGINAAGQVAGSSLVP